ncbi:MAG TPA: glycoside hydrolase family 3 N-terminal domain-containing protein [Pseudogracilibacillus sp.]|nr:glycoside hydrolase family 3 N-terminal domain-containing protein [Pseudogracilibacillus sp.]
MFDKKFTLEEKIGQLFILGHREPTVTGHITNMISTYHIGGVLLTNDSFYRPKHIYQLTNYLQRYAGIDTPIWLGVQDHHKALADKGMTATLPEAIVTAYNNRLYTKQLAEMNGDELRAVGLNFTVGPNFDFAGLTRESFMNDFRTKSQHAIAAVEGYHAASVEAVTPVHSMLHHIFANQVADKGRVLLYAEKFFNTVRSIILSNEDMMNPLITNILINKLDYDGIIVADFSHVENNAQDIIHAFKEGAHMVMLNDDADTQLMVMNDIIAAVKNGMLTETEIDLALVKVLALKQLREINIVERFDRDAFEHRHHRYLIDKILSTQVVE